MEKREKPGKVYRSLVEQIKMNKKAYVVYIVLQFITLIVLVRSAMLGQWESVMTCVLALILLLIPPFVEKNVKVQLPTALEITAYIFVFCSEILGEVNCYYIKYPMWDTMLHTVNGFMFAAFGFCLVDIFNRNRNIRFRLSAGFLAVVAFCFSMTIGVLWEFTEFAVDSTARMDMQKDSIIQEFSSVKLDETDSNKPVRVKNIKKTVITSGDKEIVIEGGYLDIGLRDTMKDLFVNFVGAVVFSIIGYIYIKQGGRSKIAASFVPVPNEVADPDDYYGPEEIE
ncbi:MAG: hypothetical protein IKR27_03875 [Lachnospiraceae bacterium]|nr:hypothetical protein [Lachnospiraceae bacterium]